MASTLKKVSVKLQLNDGVNSEGIMKLASVNLGTLDPTGYADSKATAVAEPLVNCLSKTLYGLVKTETSELY